MAVVKMVGLEGVGRLPGAHCRWGQFPSPKVGSASLHACLYTVIRHRPDGKGVRPVPVAPGRRSPGVARSAGTQGKGVGAQGRGRATPRHARGCKAALEKRVSYKGRLQPLPEEPRCCPYSQDCDRGERGPSGPRRASSWPLPVRSARQRPLVARSAGTQRKGVRAQGRGETPPGTPRGARRP